MLNLLVYFTVVASSFVMSEWSMFSPLAIRLSEDWFIELTIVSMSRVVLVEGWGESWES